MSDNSLCTEQQIQCVCVREIEIKKTKSDKEIVDT